MKQRKNITNKPGLPTFVATTNKKSSSNKAKAKYNFYRP